VAPTEAGATKRHWRTALLGWRESGSSLSAPVVPQLSNCFDCVGRPGTMTRTDPAESGTTRQSHSQGTEPVLAARWRCYVGSSPKERRVMEPATTKPPLHPPERKLKWWYGVLIVVAGLFLIGVVIKGVLAQPNNAAGISSSNNFTVSVSSSPRGNADIDVNDNGRWSQTYKQLLPWSDAFGPGIVSVAAEKGGGNGSITCTITNSDGSVRSTQTSTGPYAEVACNTDRGNSGMSGSAGNSGTSGNS